MGPQFFFTSENDTCLTGTTIQRNCSLSFVTIRRKIHISNLTFHLVKNTENLICWLLLTFLIVSLCMKTPWAKWGMSSSPCQVAVPAPKLALLTKSLRLSTPDLFTWKWAQVALVPSNCYSNDAAPRHLHGIAVVRRGCTVKPYWELLMNETSGLTSRKPFLLFEQQSNFQSKKSFLQKFYH